MIRVLKGERDINVLQIARLAPVFGLYPHEIMDSAEKLIERAERGNVPDLSTTDVATDSTATTDVSATLASADDDTMVPDMSGWSADEQAAYVVAHMDQFDIAAKKGDIEREQEAFEELP